MTPERQGIHDMLIAASPKPKEDSAEVAGTPSNEAKWSCGKLFPKQFRAHHVGEAEISYGGKVFVIGVGQTLFSFASRFW